MAWSLGAVWRASLSLKLGRVSIRKGVGGAASREMEVGLGRRGQRRVEYRGRLGKGISGSVSVSATASRAGHKPGSGTRHRETGRQIGRAGQGREGLCNGGYKDAISEWCLLLVLAGRMLTIVDMRWMFRVGWAWLVLGLAESMLCSVDFVAVAVAVAIYCCGHCCLSQRGRCVS